MAFYSNILHYTFAAELNCFMWQTIDIASTYPCELKFIKIDLKELSS